MSSDGRSTAGTLTASARSSLASSARTSGECGGARHQRWQQQQATRSRSTPSQHDDRSSQSREVDEAKLDDLVETLRAQFSTSHQSLREHFRQWDADGSGSVDIDELQVALQDMGLQLSKAECEALTQRFDNNGDGCIQYDDLVDLMCGHEELLAFTASRPDLHFITHPVEALESMRQEENMSGKILTWAGRQARRPLHAHDVAARPGFTTWHAASGISEADVFCAETGEEQGRRAPSAIVVGEIGMQNGRDALVRLKAKRVRRMQVTGSGHLDVGTAPAWHAGKQRMATYDGKQQWLSAQQAHTAATVSTPAQPAAEVRQEPPAPPGGTAEAKAEARAAAPPEPDQDFKLLIQDSRKLRQQQALAQATHTGQPRRGLLGRPVKAAPTTLAGELRQKKLQAQARLGMHHLLHVGPPQVSRAAVRQQHSSSVNLIAPRAGQQDQELLQDKVAWKSQTALFRAGAMLPDQYADKMKVLSRVARCKEAQEAYQARIRREDAQRKAAVAADLEQRRVTAEKTQAAFQREVERRNRDDLWEHTSAASGARLRAHPNPAFRSDVAAFGFGPQPQA